MERKNPIIEIGIKINDAFIEKWQPKYDEFEEDDKDYKIIIAKISNELSCNGTISEGTFIDILHWKAHRLMGIVRLNEYDTYEKAFRHCFKAPNDEKLAILDELCGIGVPVASTIHHFMYPRHFPIMDIRTAETLYHAGYIASKIRDQKRYILYQSAILTIAKDHPKWSLRQIDRALFAYHKIDLGPKIKGSEGKVKRCL